MMQKVIMVGNLTKDPEKVQGQELCKISIAVKNDYKNSDGVYGYEFFNLAVWNRLSEIAIKYLHKGSKILIVGRLQNRSWESNGVKKYATEIIVKELEILTGQQKKQELEFVPINIEDLPF